MNTITNDTVCISQVCQQFQAKVKIIPSPKLKLANLHTCPLSKVYIRYSRSQCINAGMKNLEFKHGVSMLNYMEVKSESCSNADIYYKLIEIQLACISEYTLLTFHLIKSAHNNLELSCFAKSTSHDHNRKKNENKMKKKDFNLRESNSEK